MNDPHLATLSALDSQATLYPLLRSRVHHPNWPFDSCAIACRPRRCLVIIVVVEAIRGTVLVGVVLVGTKVSLIVLVVHVLRRLLGLVVGTLAVVSVHAWKGRQISAPTRASSGGREHTLGLGEFVDFTTNKAEWRRVRKRSLLIKRSVSTYPARSSLANACETVLPNQS